MGYTNSDIITLALKGKSGETKSGNMSVETDRGYYFTGYLSKRLKSILNHRARGGHIKSVIYSYATPIAWNDEGKWIVPDATYSTTTSCKHQSQLYRLPGSKWIPNDESLEVYERILDGALTYSRGYGKKLGTYSAA